MDAPTTIWLIQNRKGHGKWTTRFVSHKAAQAAAHYNGLNAHSGWHKRIVDAATMRVIDKDGMVEVT
jgi:hypothetical protein